MASNSSSTWKPATDSARVSNRIGLINPVIKPSHEGNTPPQAAHADEHGTRQDARKPEWGWIATGLLLAVGIGAALFFLGWKPAAERKANLVTEANLVKSAPLRVAITKPKRSESMLNLQLPGEVRAERETAIYARISGY